MAHIVIVGSEKCKIIDVCNVLMETENSPLDLATLPILSKKLGVNATEIQATLFQALAKVSTCFTLLDEILAKWHNSKSDKSKLEVLCTALKSMKMEDLANALELKFVTLAKLEEDVLDFESIDKPLSVEVTLPSKPQTWRKDDYNLPVDGKGYALILNIKTFDPFDDSDPDLCQSKREGSECDVKYMSDLWRELGYNTFPGPAAQKQERKTAAEVKNWVDSFKEECIKNNAKSIVIFIGSHGEYEKIETSDNKSLDLYAHIFNKFTTEACDCCNKDEEAQNACGANCTRWLIDIPKMFFVSACQNFDERRQADANGLAKIYNLAIMFAQFPGFTAYRGVSFGSFFAYVLTDVFMKNAHKVDVWTMMKMVAVKLIKATGKKEQLAQAYPFGLQKLYLTLKPVN